MRTAEYLAGNLLLGFHADHQIVHFGSIDTIFAGAGILAIIGGPYALLRLPKQPASSGATTSAAA